MNLGLVAGAALLAVAVTVRSTWSPCGLSMLSTVTPLAERGRGPPLRATAAWFVVGAIAGGATLGAGGWRCSLSAWPPSTSRATSPSRSRRSRQPSRCRRPAPVRLPAADAHPAGRRGLARQVPAVGVRRRVRLADRRRPRDVHHDGGRLPVDRARRTQREPDCRVPARPRVRDGRGLAVLLGARITGPNELLRVPSEVRARRSVRPCLRHRRRRRAGVRRRRRRHEPRRSRSCSPVWSRPRPSGPRAPVAGQRPPSSRPPEAIPPALRTEWNVF